MDYKYLIERMRDNGLFTLASNDERQAAADAIEALLDRAEKAEAENATLREQVAGLRDEDCDGAVMVGWITGHDKTADEFAKWYGDGSGWLNSFRAGCSFMEGRYTALAAERDRLRERLAETIRKNLELSQENRDGK